MFDLPELPVPEMIQQIINSFVDIVYFCPFCQNNEHAYRLKTHRVNASIPRKIRYQRSGMEKFDSNTWQIEKDMITDVRPPRNFP